MVIISKYFRVGRSVPRGCLVGRVSKKKLHELPSNKTTERLLGSPVTAGGCCLVKGIFC